MYFMKMYFMKCFTFHARAGLSSMQELELKRSDYVIQISLAWLTKKRTLHVLESWSRSGQNHLISIARKTKVTRSSHDTRGRHNLNVTAKNPLTFVLKNMLSVKTSTEITKASSATPNANKGRKGRTECTFAFFSLVTKVSLEGI